MFSKNLAYSYMLDKLVDKLRYFNIQCNNFKTLSSLCVPQVNIKKKLSSGN